MGEIRIVGPGKTPGYPYPVCKKSFSHSLSFLLSLAEGLIHVSQLKHSLKEPLNPLKLTDYL